MNLTLAIVRKTKKRNKLYYTGDDPEMLQWVALNKNWHGVIILDLFFAVTTMSNHLTFANKVQLTSYYYLY